MTDSVVLSSKYQAEIHQFVADFTGQLQPGESFVAGNVSVSVFLSSGTDPNATAILVTPFTLVGNVVSQGLQQGVPGCIYVVVIHAVTNLSRGLTLTARLAVLPNNYPATGAFIPYYFTSQPYPYFYGVDTLHIGGQVISAQVFSTIYNYQYNVDTMHFGASVQSAMVFPALKEYDFGDTMNFGASVQSAMIFPALKSYSYPEIMHVQAAVVSALVTTTLITYQYNTETLHFGASVQSAVVT